MTVVSIAQTSSRQESISSESLIQAPRTRGPLQPHRCEPSLGHQRVQKITKDLLGTYNGINANYYAKRQDEYLRRAILAMPDQNEADRLVRKLGVYLVGSLKEAVERADLVKAAAALKTAKLEMDALKQAIGAIQPQDSQGLPDEQRAEAIVSSLGGFWGGNLKEAIVKGDLEKALHALDSSRNNIRLLQNAMNALHPKDSSIQPDPHSAQIAVESLGAFFTGKLREAIKSENMTQALFALERMRYDIGQVQEAMNAARGEAPDLEKAGSIMQKLGFYFSGPLKKVILKGSLKEAVELLGNRRIDYLHLTEAINAFHPSGERIEPDRIKVTSALDKLGFDLFSCLERALQTRDLRICVEVLDECRTDIKYLKEAINALQPKDKESKPDPVKAAEALAKIQMPFEGMLKVAVEKLDLGHCFNVLQWLRENSRKQSYAKDKLLAEGSYGKVFQGTHRSTGIAVAIKQTKLDKKEAETLALLHRHGIPHVVYPLEVFASSPDKEQHINIVMPEQMVLSAKTALSLTEISSMAFQGEVFLREMQRIHMMHNDIKQKNTSWERRSHYLSFFDFGMACSCDDPKLSSPKAIMHTAPWRPPESIFKKLPLDRTMDYFSWGITLIEYYLGGDRLFPCKDNTIESMRQHVLAWQDQIGDPTDEYLAQCIPKRLQQIYVMENGKPKRDENGKLIIQPITLPRIDPTPWQERMRAKAKAEGDDLAKLEALIHHIEGLMTYAGRRELREVNFFPNISMHLEETLHPDQTIEIYPADATEVTKPILSIRGGVSYSCLHIPINTPSETAKFRYRLFEKGKVGSLQDIEIRNGDFVNFGFPKRKPMEISPLRPKKPSSKTPSASAPGAQSASQSTTAPDAPRQSTRRLLFEERKEEKKDGDSLARHQRMGAFSTLLGNPAGIAQTSSAAPFSPKTARELEPQKDKDKDKD